MTNEAIKALLVFALYGILEVMLCFSSVQELKVALITKFRRVESDRSSRSNVRH